MLDDKFKIKQNQTDYSWHSRGKIPHLDEKLVPQFVTFRLADSMPQSVLDKWRSLSLTDSQFRRRIEKYLDAGYGACHLSNPEVAKMVENALKFHAGTKYDLNAWVVCRITDTYYLRHSTVCTCRRSCTRSSLIRLSRLIKYLAEKDSFGSTNRSTDTFETADISELLFVTLREIRSRRGCAVARKIGNTQVVSWASPFERFAFGKQGCLRLQSKGVLL